MKIIDLLENAIKADDVVSKALPALKVISNILPFPDRHQYISDPSIVKHLLLLHSFIQESTDLILYQLLDIFREDANWLSGCCRAIEEYAALNSRTKLYSLDYLEAVIVASAEMRLDIDDLCYGFIVLLKHADSEQMVLSIMKKIEAIKIQLNHRLKHVNQFDELVEQTILKLYQEEVQRNSEEQLFKLAAIELNEKSQKRKSQKNLVQGSPNSIGSLNDSFSEQVVELINVDNMLCSENPRIEYEHIEQFKSVESVQNLVAFITDPVAQQPSLIYETDLLADAVFKNEKSNYKQHRHTIKIDKLYTLRSFKMLLFLTDLSNHHLMLEANPHFIQIVFRCISGFFQNPHSQGNIMHIMALLQFYLKHETKECLYYMFHFNFHFQLLELLYNVHVVDFILRLLDPQDQSIPDPLQVFVWQFLNSQNFLPYIVNRITNKDLVQAHGKDFTILKEGYNIIKKIKDIKISLSQEDFNYSAAAQIDYILGPLLAGKTIHLNLDFLKRSLLKKKPSQVMLSRRQTELNPLNKLKEYLFIHELQVGGRDIDKIGRDVVERTLEHHERNTLPAAIIQSEQIIFEERRSRKTDRSSPYQTVHVIPSSRISSNQSIGDGQLPQISQSKKGNATHQPKLSITKALTKQFGKLNFEQVGSDKLKTQQESRVSFFNNMDVVSNRTMQPLISPASSFKSFIYPNSDCNVIDIQMREDIDLYCSENNEEVSYLHAQLLNSICKVMVGPKRVFFFQQFTEDNFQMLNRLFTHYNLRLVELYEKLDEINSAYECGQVLVEILKSIEINQKSTEQAVQLCKEFVPKICRNIVVLHQQTISLLKLGTIKITLFQCLILLISCIRQRGHRLFLKINETALHIINLDLFTFPKNQIYQELHLKFMRHMLVYATDKQIVTLLFKINLIETIADGYKSLVINNVVISDPTAPVFLLHLARLSQLILLTLDGREDLLLLKQMALRLQSYERMKDIIALYKNRSPKIMKLEAQEFQAELSSLNPKKKQ